MPRRKTPTDDAPHTATEREFLNTLIAAARAASYSLCFHIVDRGHNAASKQAAQRLAAEGRHELAQLITRGAHAKVTSSGFPDLVMHHPQRGILIAELKSDRPSAKPTSEQLEWLHAFNQSLRPPDNPYAKGRAHLWRPKDWPAIETQLGIYGANAACRCPLCETPEDISIT